MDELLSFEVTINYSNRQAWTTQFLAEGWTDAMPQAAEIVEGNGNDDHIVDVKINRVAGE